MKEYFTINDLSTMTMLSTRTIRNYITQGFLNGEKIEGVWRFTTEDIDTFLQENYVNQSIQSKRNGIVFNYMCNVFLFLQSEEKDGSNYINGYNTRNSCANKILLP